MPPREIIYVIRIRLIDFILLLRELDLNIAARFHKRRRSNLFSILEFHFCQVTPGNGTTIGYRTKITKLN